MVESKHTDLSDRIDDHKYTFTVFTPTYNRAHTIHRVYESLKAQTYQNFEWLIVDDGSTDRTQQLIKQWQQEAQFPIRYFYQQNSGKHVAFNRGVALARGEFFLNFDSDDACTPEALERFKFHWIAIPDREKHLFSAVTCLCQDEAGNIVGSQFPENCTDSNSLELYYRFKVKGEKWGFHRTNVLQKFPFPEIQQQKFVPENIVWFQIARNYKTRFVNEPLRIYFNGSDRLMTSGSPQLNPLGHALCHRESLNNELDYFLDAPLMFLRSAVHFSRFSFHAKVNAIQQYSHLRSAFARLLWSISLPIGYLVYLKDIKRA